MTTIIDTNVLIALTNKNDSLHEAAKEAVTGLQGSRVLLPVLILTEVLILEPHPLSVVEKCRTYWPDIIATTEEEMLLVAEFPVEVRKKLKANDCLILAHCLVHEARLLTFDRKLRQAYDEVLLS